MRPTLASLAQSLGVSTATVSNVFSRPGKVSEELRSKVLAEAVRVGYAGPDPAGRHLRRGRTDALGLVFTDEMSFAFEDQASVTFLAGVSQACEGSGRSLVLMPAGPPVDGGPIAAVDAAAVDGIIVYSVPDDDPNLLAVRQRNLPVVIVDQPRDGPPVDWVGVDDRAAGRELALHLTGLGHRRVGVITSRLGRSRRNGPVSPADRDTASYAVQRERLVGLTAAFAEVGIDAAALAVEERFDSSRTAGAAAFDALISRRPDLTAVCCLADVLALGALDAAAARGLDVPADVSIVGFDDIPDAARVGLTTIHQPLAEKGRVAGDLLLRQIERYAAGTASGARRRTLPTTLQVRASTGPAPTTRHPRSP